MSNFSISRLRAPPPVIPPPIIAKAGATGDTLFDDELAVPVPAALVAVTVNV